ncbi:MAG: hypothetical protein NUW37_04275 [Planctomycetes bacterium]|nr:hypothetical protein [Planctomycetota bacterium]
MRNPAPIILVATFLAVCSPNARAAEYPLPEGLQEEVNDAIDKGMAWIASLQQPDGSFPYFQPGHRHEGATSLGLLTLVKSGWNPRDARFTKGFEFVKTMMDNHRQNGDWATYSVAITMMALEGWQRALNPPRAPRLSREEQADPNFVPGVAKVNLPRELQAWMTEMLQWMVGRMNQNGMWTYTSGASGEDFSNTQLALLGIAAAYRCGINVPNADIFKGILDRYLREQQQDGDVIPRNTPIKPLELDRSDPHATSSPGRWEYFTDARNGDRARGFPYVPGDPGSVMGSMTCGGIVGLVLSKSLLKEIKPDAIDLEFNIKIDQAIYDALAWLRQNFNVETNPRRGGAGAQWHYYYLYSLERVGVLVGTEHIGEHLWYHEGARYLVDQQSKDRANAGSWMSGIRDHIDKPEEQRFVDTSWALLFLKRGTMPMRIAITPPPTRPTTSQQ